MELNLLTRESSWQPWGGKYPKAVPREIEQRETEREQDEGRERMLAIFGSKSTKAHPFDFPYYLTSVFLVWRGLGWVLLLTDKESWPIFMGTPMLARAHLHMKRIWFKPCKFGPWAIFQDVAFQHCILCNVSRMKNTNKRKEEETGPGIGQVFLLFVLSAFFVCFKIVLFI